MYSLSHNFSLTLLFVFGDFMVLIACEESQVECLAFRSLGVEAFSCDLQPCSGGFPGWHIQTDVRSVLFGGTDFFTSDGVRHHVESWSLIVAHPPCTFLSNAGARWLYRDGVLNEDRYLKGLAALDFFNLFLSLPGRVCIENPVPSAIWGLPCPSQIIQPYEFGEPYSKRTCFWLRGLPNLFASCFCSDFSSYVFSSYSGDRAKHRSKSFPGVASAMARQWYKYCFE